jgi:hypothetical protein
MSTADAPSLARCLARLDTLAPDARPPRGAWDTHQALVHCAQGIEYSVRGFPRLRSGLIRATVGRLVLSRFLRRGAMSHDLGAVIPGAPEIAPGGSVADAVARLRAAIAEFHAHQGAYAPHFVYGPVTREQYDAIHAMHIEDHLRG